MNKEQTRQERLKAIRQNILDSGRPNGYEYIEEYLLELENNLKELKELLKQPVPTYASAIKLLDEIEKIIESRK